jgi:hypothetical protein
MIYFNLSIDNPFSQRWKTLFFNHGCIGQFKGWEFNGYATHSIINLDFSLKIKGDHPGIFILCGLLGYAVEFNFYDSRHEDHT